MSTIRLSTSSARELPVDALVVGLLKGTNGPLLRTGSQETTAGLDTAFQGNLVATLTTLGATGAAGQITKIPTLGAITAPVLVAVGLGPNDPDADGYDVEVLRRAAGAAARSLAGTGHVGLALPVAVPGGLAAIAEGTLLGAYAFLRYRTAATAGHEPPVGSFTLLADDSESTAEGTTAEETTAEGTTAEGTLTRAAVLADAVHLCRDLVNTAPSELYPETFAAAAVSSADGLALKVDVMDDAALRAGGYGGITGVGQGSAQPPRLVTLTYTHPKATRHLALVGKGITFDSGGLSLKPAQAMELMKSDMGGAAAVIAAMTAITRLGLAVNVTGWAPMAENMPSGTAIRPSDVLTIYGGKTVEVLNTDAEGRLILADALARASEDSPDLIVDVATLTGAQTVALGARTSAIMSTDDELREKIHDATRRAGESMWPMPLPPELRKSMDSEVADIANIGDRFGGMLVAGLFLSEFVGEGIRWAHLDIAGPAFESGEPYGYTVKGGTGVGVRTLVQVAQDLADGRL